MSGDDVVELSSDSNVSFCDAGFDKDKEFGSCEGVDREDVSGGCYSQAVLSNSSSSSCFDDCSASGSENDGFEPKPLKFHAVSSSDDEPIASTQLDQDSGVVGVNHSGDSTSLNTYSSASQSSLSTQERNAEKAARGAERERLRLGKRLAQEEKKREREAKRKQREELKRIKQTEKQLKKQQLLRRNQMKPNECLKYMTLVIDEKLARTVLCSKAVEKFPYPDVKFNFEKQTIDNSITWTRSQLDGSWSEEDWVAVMWTGDEVAQGIADSVLVTQFKHISQNVYKNKTILLLIFAMNLYYRKGQNSKSYFARKEGWKSYELIGPSQSQPREKYLPRDKVELGLVELQILTGVCHRHFENSDELADVLGQFTKAIAEVPYKTERELVDMEMGWHGRSANKNCVRPNRDMQGLDKLWLEHLSVFNNFNVDSAKAVAALYPTPSSLMEAYENCSTQKEKELLLQNLQVKRSEGSSAVIRRIGPEASKKICLTFTESDGNVKLSNK